MKKEDGEKGSTDGVSMYREKRDGPENGWGLVVLGSGDGGREDRRRYRSEEETRVLGSRLGRPAAGWVGSTPAVAIGSQSLTGCLAVRSSAVHRPLL